MLLEKMENRSMKQHSTLKGAVCRCTLFFQNHDQYVWVHLSSISVFTEKRVTQKDRGCSVRGREREAVSSTALVVPYFIGVSLSRQAQSCSIPNIKHSWWGHTTLQTPPQHSGTAGPWPSPSRVSMRQCQHVYSDCYKYDPSGAHTSI